MALAVVATADLGAAFDLGGSVTGKINLALDTYRYKKAINANSTLVGVVATGVPPVEAMVDYAQSGTSSGGSAHSTVMMAATQPIPATSGGDFETLVLSPWLTSLGYTSSSSPTNAGLIATLRAAALALTF